MGAVVGDVAHLAGFNDPSYFCKVFKRYTNFSPARFSVEERTGAGIEPVLYAIETES